MVSCVLNADCVKNITPLAKLRPPEKLFASEILNEILFKNIVVCVLSVSYFGRLSGGPSHLKMSRSGEIFISRELVR